TQTNLCSSALAVTMCMKSRLIFGTLAPWLKVQTYSRPGCCSQPKAIIRPETIVKEHLTVISSLLKQIMAQFYRFGQSEPLLDSTCEKTERALTVWQSDILFSSVLESKRRANRNRGSSQ